MQSALAGLSSQPQTGAQPAAEPQQYTPAVSARKSLASPDHIISMIDGQPYKTLRRHLARHGLTGRVPAEVGLKADYPMVSQSYSEVRRDMAKKIGLGRKARSAVVAPEPQQATAAPAAKPARGRRRKAGAEAA